MSESTIDCWSSGKINNKYGFFWGGILCQSSLEVVILTRNHWFLFFQLPQTLDRRHRRCQRH